MKRRTLMGAGVLGGLATLGFPAFAQAAYPNRAITMVVPFPPGGLADLVGRPVAEAMSRDLGQPVVVENKAGAGGGIGMAQVAKARPDGYTVLMALSSLTVIPEADTLMGRAPMFNLPELKALARYTADPTVLAVRADAPWKNLKDFIDDARQRPGAINFGSSGNYGTMHVPMELLKTSANLRMVHIPYTGAAPAIVAMLGGQIDAVATGPATVLQHVKAGRVRVLAHWGADRLASMPEVPSLKEMGQNIDYAQWSGLFIPTGVSEPIAQRLRAAAKFAANDSRVKEVIQGAGSPLQYLDAPEFEAYVAADARRMVEVVKRIGKLQ